ncbi:hypothetical protein V8E55_011217 [Tylopilus felleus]
MHLTSNISKLLLDLWSGSITCMPTDNIATWDWAIFLDKQHWEVHGQAAQQSGSFLPQSFATKPHNIAEKRNSDYKTQEFIMYMFGLTPGLLHTLLPDIYWLNFCKLVRGFQIVSQHEITHEDAFEGCVLLASWEHEFKEIYYQRLNDRLHFIWPCIHQVAHLGPETFQKGPSICIAHNLEYDIRQPSNYLVNFAMEGVRRAHINALLAALLELDDTRTGCPQGAVDLGNGYALLCKQDKMPVLPSDGTMGAIFKYLNHPNPMPKILCWARLLLPNKQIACSAWQEKHQSSADVRVSHMVKFKLAGHIMYGEVVYFTRLAVPANNDGELWFTNVGLIHPFSSPDNDILQASWTTVPLCRNTEAVLVVHIEDILSVVTILPYVGRMANNADGDAFFVVEQPGHRPQIQIFWAQVHKGIGSFRVLQRDCNPDKVSETLSRWHGSGPERVATQSLIR